MQIAGSYQQSAVCNPARISALRTSALAGRVIVLALAVAGCASTDPYERPGVWHPTGVNAANLRAMVSVPSDLAIGRGDNRGNAEPMAVALDRYHHDTVLALPTTSVSSVGPTGATNPNGGTSGAAGTAGPTNGGS
jgi:type IV pilus biogenesis protein CpaD/CtpE